MRIPLLANSSKGISTNVSSQELINFFYEAPPTGEGHVGAILPVHGTSLFASIGSAAHRVGGLMYNPIDDLLYGVLDTSLYEITSAAVATNRVTLATSSGTVQMALNPTINEITIVDGNTGKYFQCGPNTGGTIVDADFPTAATCVIHHNGYFIVNHPTTPGRFHWSDLNSSTAYTSTSFATAQSITSPIRAMIEHKGLIYFFGDVNGEIFYNEGSTTSTFTRVDYLHTGIVAQHTLQRFDNSIAWLSRSKAGELHVVMMAGGYQPQVISTPELNYTWQRLSAVEDAYSYVYTVDGHEFYVITFPTSSVTYAYDALTKRWHQRSGPFSAGLPTRDGVASIAFCGHWGGHVVGDSNAAGRLLSIDSSTYTWAGVNMERRVTGPMMSLENESMFRFSEVQVDIEEGVATGVETGNDGQVTLSYSKDGGHTYSTGVQLALGVGASTGYKTRLMKRKLGSGRLWNFRVYTDTFRKIIIKGAYGRLFGEPKEGFPKVSSQVTG